MKAFTSHSTLCTKRAAKAPRGNQQLEVKQAVKNRLGTRQLHSAPASARQNFWLVWKKCLPLQGSHQTVNVPSDSQADCALLQAQAAAIVLWPLLGTNSCNHPRKFQKSGTFLLLLVRLWCCSYFLRTRLTLGCFLLLHIVKISMFDM